MNDIKTISVDVSLPIQLRALKFAEENGDAYTMKVNETIVHLKYATGGQTLQTALTRFLQNGC